MTRCFILDAWFDEQSKKIDKKESKNKVDFVTGKKKE